MTSNVVGAIVKSLKISLVVKVINFLINVMIVRFSSMPDLGKIHVNLQLVVSACLFVLKEGFRRAALRESDFANGYHVMVLGLLLTLLLLLPLVVSAYTLLTGERVVLMSILAASIAMEALAELPLFIHVASRGNFTIRYTCDMVSGTVRSVALISVVGIFNDVPLAFATAQLAAAAAVVVISLSGITLSSFSRRFCYPASFSYEMVFMSIQKFFLTEGEKMLSVALLSSTAVGQLALVNNIGSLVLRLIFAPIEDIASSALAVQKKSIQNRKRTLQSVFLIEVSIGLLGLAFGPQCAHAAVFILYGSQWSADSSIVLLLQVYCFLLLLFAINGSLEAYYFAIGDASRIKVSMTVQWFAFAAFILISWLALPSCGPLAILLGNAASMTLRSVCCLPIFDEISDPIHPQMKSVAFMIAVGGVASHLALYLFPWNLLLTWSPLRVAFARCVVVGGVAVLTILFIRKPVAIALSSVNST
jgi:oligosaccharide translocation protein RFT1